MGADATLGSCKTGNESSGQYIGCRRQLSGGGEADEALLTLRGRRDEIFANCHVDAVSGIPLPHAFQNRDEDVFGVGRRTSRSKEMGWRVSWDAEVRRLSLGLSLAATGAALACALAQLMIKWVPQFSLEAKKGPCHVDWPTFSRPTFSSLFVVADA